MEYHSKELLYDLLDSEPFKETLHCNESQKLFLLLDKQLPAESASRLRLHMKDCAICQVKYKDLIKIYWRLDRVIPTVRMTSEMKQTIDRELDSTLKKLRFLNKDLKNQERMSVSWLLHALESIIEFLFSKDMIKIYLLSLMGTVIFTYVMTR